MSEESDILRLLAPDRKLRAALNMANIAAVQERPDEGLTGPAVAITERVAAALGCRVETQRYGSGAQVLSALGAWDIAFLAVERSRLDRLAYSIPYLVAEATLAGWDDAVDRPPGEGSATIAVAEGAGYLSALRGLVPEARLRAFPTPAAAFAAMVARDCSLAAGLRSSLEAAAGEHTGIRISRLTFQKVDHAVAVPRERAKAVPFVNGIIAGLFPCR